MKNSKALLLEYLDSISDPDRAAALFAEDGALELPFLRSLGVGARYAGRREIAALLHQLRKLYPDIAFAPNDINVFIETVSPAGSSRKINGSFMTSLQRRSNILEPGGRMKRRTSNKRAQIEAPVWCDECRLRIAPYEEAAIAGSRAFHKNCFRKAERKGSGEEELLEGSGLDLVVA